MAKVIPIGEPVNEAERRAIAHLRDHLPKSYLLVHNFEIERNGQLFEVDLAVIAPHAVYLVDVKGTRGLIDIYGSKWYPEGRQPYTSPLIKLRGHCKTLKGIITESQPGRRDLGEIYTDAAVLLTAPDAVVQDPGGRDGPSVTSLNKSVAYFQNAGRVPARFSKNIARLHKMVLKALQAVAKKRSGPLRFGNWEVEERLGGTLAYTEYRAYNAIAGRASGSVLLRSYSADPYLPEAERMHQRSRIANAYKALNGMPGHPGVVSVRDFFATESEDRYILVTEDVVGQALRLHIDKPTHALTLDQKLRVAGDLLNALAHTHQHQVVHRNLTPSTVLLGGDGRLRVVGFDFARTGTDRSMTIAAEIVDELESDYQAPEVYREPQNASPASDVFSAGLVLYEVFAGDKPFGGPTELFDQSGVFPVKPSDARGELPGGFDSWLQGLCAFDPDRRPSAAQAAADLTALLAPKNSDDVVDDTPAPAPEPAPEPAEDVDYHRLTSGTNLTHKYVVQKRLGKPGAFGVVYKVIDTLGDVSRAMKLILRDRHSTLERLKKEYRTLLRVPEHPHVVKVIDADLLPGGGPPFIVFEYVDGLDVGEMVDGGLFAPEDALDLARQVAEGLGHLHRHGVYHCDIKPRNLLWTDHGVRIIDFNVSVLAASDKGHGGGSRRYLPPDLDLSAVPQPSDLADRDLYALGLTIFEAVVGGYPWTSTTPPPAEPAPDPRKFAGCPPLTGEFVDIIMKAIAPRRAERFASATELLDALNAIRLARRPRDVEPFDGAWSVGGLGDGGLVPPNTNPFVSRLLTVYSQSEYSNVGTRGLDVLGEKTYVETELDRKLEPAVFAGEFKLVLITGNAGDGKTAFLQRLEARATEAHQAVFAEPLPNGRQFSLQGRTYLTNYDGSQDEGEETSDDVLRAFFAPYAGADESAWPSDEVRLIAINEGRLVDFLTSENGQFELLGRVVQEGLVTGVPAHGVAVVNLNLRSVVANSLSDDADALAEDDSIFARQISRLAHESFWEPCQGCDLKDRCYVFHNARSFQDPTASPQIIRRLKTLYTLTHLRGRLHMTLRDLRSALAFMFVGTRDCDEIHALYQRGDRAAIAAGFYFNSWMGGDTPSADRLLTLLKDVDVGSASDPRQDRAFDFVSPVADKSLFGFAERGQYDRDVLRSLFDLLPRDFSGKPSSHRAQTHQRYVAMARRRAFFERRDGGWTQMLPYKAAEKMLALVRGERALTDELPRLIQAVNRGEGLSDPQRLAGKLALQVRHVDRGTVRSYRVFAADRFSLHIAGGAEAARFVEHMPSGMVLRYQGAFGNAAELIINLDVYEMLERLNDGYRPSIEEEQGYYLSLAVFKNVLGSEPYQEVLLTTTGHDFYRIERHDSGRLEMSELGREVV